MNDCKDDINADRDIAKMGKSLELMNKRSLRIELIPGYNSRSLNLLEHGDGAFNNAPLLAIASLSYRAKVHNSYNDEDCTILRAKITPQQLLTRSRDYDPKIDAYGVERSLEAMLNDNILARVSRIDNK